MRFSTRARTCPFLTCICARVRCFHAVCSPLGNGWPETKTRGSKERVREEQKCREEGGENRRRRRARIGWWRESSLGLCQMTLARTRPPRWWSREYFYHYRHFLSSPRWSLVRARDGTPEEIHEGHRSHGDEESTVSWETSAELHACTYILYFVNLFQREIFLGISVALLKVIVADNERVR